MMVEQVLLMLSVRCDDHAPGRVRSCLQELPQIEEMAEDASLVASELVTNALVHSGCTSEDSLAVKVERTDERLVVSVRDPGYSGHTAHVAPPRPPGDGGLGLRIVEMVASDWGQSRGDGYRVWAELPLVAAG